jgi:hypothetical protein
MSSKKVRQLMAIPLEDVKLSEKNNKILKEVSIMAWQVLACQSYGSREYISIMKCTHLLLANYIRDHNKKTNNILLALMAVKIAWSLLNQYKDESFELHMLKEKCPTWYYTYEDNIEEAHQTEVKLLKYDISKCYEYMEYEEKPTKKLEAEIKSLFLKQTGLKLSDGTDILKDIYKNLRLVKDASVRLTDKQKSRASDIKLMIWEALADNSNITINYINIVKCAGRVINFIVHDNIVENDIITALVVVKLTWDYMNPDNPFLYEDLKDIHRKWINKFSLNEFIQYRDIIMDYVNKLCTIFIPYDSMSTHELYKELKIYYKMQTAKDDIDSVLPILCSKMTEFQKNQLDNV